MGVTYMPGHQRLFIDSSKRSLKCVILHNGNVYGTFPIGHSIELKENHCSVNLVVGSLQYENHNWKTCVDLKMVNFLLGQQSGYTKYPCFLCFWDSRAKQKHWCTTSWPERRSLNCDVRNVVNDPPVDRNNTLLPPQHIKLGIMKQSVNALDHDSDCFKYISAAFPGLNEEKTKGRILDGPQIRKLMKDPQQVEYANKVEHEKHSKTFARISQEITSLPTTRVLLKC